MTTGTRTVLYPVKDIAAAKQIYGALLGVAPIADAPYYVGYQAAGFDIGLVPNGHEQGLNGSVAYWEVADINQSFASLIAAGAKEVQPVRDVGGGKLVATVKDADGNVIGLTQNP